jgi:hypothetical protein
MALIEAGAGFQPSLAAEAATAAALVPAGRQTDLKTSTTSWR